jgi:hypothetical protein
VKLRRNPKAGKAGETGETGQAERQGRVVPDSTAAVSREARAEARKGTAAADPVIGVTPEGQVLPGAVVDGQFVEADRPSHTEGPPSADAEPGEGTEQAATRSEKAVAAGELPGENKRMKHVWFAGRAAKGEKED